jgi:hypothetical protein
MQRSFYELVPVIGDIISSHCPGTTARDRFLRACLGMDWDEVKAMIDGMLAEPWHLRGHQEKRLREFLDLIPIGTSPNSLPRWRLTSRHAGHFTLTHDVDRPDR